MGRSILNEQIRKQAKRGTTARNSSPRTEKPFSKSMGKINHSNNENVNILNTPSQNTSQEMIISKGKVTHQTENKEYLNMGRQNIVNSQKRPISNLDMPRQMAGDSYTAKESSNIF